MHPRRWGWFLALLDTQQRPLFLPDANRPWNAAGVLEEVASQQVVGSIQGLPVVTDPNIETNLGTGGDEDPVYVLSRIRRCAVGVGDQGKGITGDQGAEPHGAVAAVWLPGVLCGPLPAERRRDHGVDRAHVGRSPAAAGVVSARRPRGCLAAR
jgi:hypothetical protein